MSQNHVFLHGQNYILAVRLISSHRKMKMKFDRYLHGVIKNDQKIRFTAGLCMDNNIWCPDGKHEECHTIIISSLKFNQILNVNFHMRSSHYTYLFMCVL